MKKSIIFYIICAVFACNSVFAQRVNLTKAAEAYEQFAYVDAIETYERIAAKGFRSQEMLQQLANAYYFRADYQSGKDGTRNFLTLMHNKLLHIFIVMLRVLRP